MLPVGKLFRTTSLVKEIQNVSNLSWERFRTAHDPLSASHDGLRKQLIPNWLARPKDLSDKIESSAYGETPLELLERFLERLQVRPGDTVLDLGSGAGNLCAVIAQRGLKAIGIERNPKLHQLALLYRQSHPESSWELHLADFLELEWPRTDFIYTTSTRFPHPVLRALGEKLDTTSSIKAAVCLGKPLPLSPTNWETVGIGQVQVRWNPSEEKLSETAYLHRRTCLTVQSGCI